MFFFHDFKAVLAPRLHRSLTRPPLMDAYVRKRAQLTDFATKKKKEEEEGEYDKIQKERGIQR